MTKKKTIISTMLGLSALSLAFGFVGLRQPIQAKADSQFVMIPGASVRMKNDDAGIRFMANVPEGSTAEYKMLILPEDVLTQNGIEDNFVTELSTIYATEIANAGGFDNLFWNKSCTPFVSTRYGYVISGAMTGLPETTYAESFVGIAYTVENGEYTYADYKLKEGSETEKQTIFDNARTISYVASAALSDENPLVDLTTDNKTTLKGFVAPVLNGNFSLTETVLDLKVQRTALLSIDADCDLKAVWTSEDEDVATVDENGVVTGVSIGETTITAKIGDDYSASCNVTVSNDINNALVNSAPLTHTSGYNYFYTNVAVAENSTVQYNNANTIKYTVSDDGRSSTAGRRWFAPMEFDTENPVSNILSTMDLTTNDIQENTYVRFYVKNTSAYQLRFIFMKGATIDLNSVDSAVNNTDNEVTVAANSDWTKVDLPLISVYEALKNTTEKVSLCAGFLSTGNPFEAQTYYMGGFEIYTPSKEDVVANHATYLAGAYEAGVTNAQKSVYDGETVIAYNVVVGEKISTVSGTTKNVFANMFVGQNGIPADVLEAYGITSTAWANGIRISFDVYSTDAIDFKMHTSNSTSVPIMGGSNTGTKVATTTAGAWTNVTIDFTDVTSATFTGWARIVTVKSCSSYEVGSTAYTYYVKNFSIEERTVETLLPTYAQYLGTWNEAGMPTAQKADYQGETVVKYDVVVGEKIANISGRSKNVFANMFVGKNGLPADLLNVCGVSTTDWQNGVKISFEVYSDVAIEFRKHYTSETSTPGMSSTTGEVVKTTTAGEWTKVEIDFSEVTSATFTGWARIMTKVACSSYDVGSTAYTYYVKDFTITVS